MTEFVHISVLSRELMAGLNIQPGGHYLDATVGGGGHTRGILETFPDVRVTAIDQDALAIAAAAVKLADYGDRLEFWRGNFADYPGDGQTWDGIIADLGVSSAQLDTSDRGFSFRQEAALDMRMDQRQALTAAVVINTWDAPALAEIFFTYGEERLSRRIAQRIVERRPFQTTTELAAAIAQVVPSKYRYGRIHPATRVFQALRIAVNRELTCLETFLQRAPHWLKPGGRIGVISFHSLEDRIVKHSFRNHPDLQVLTKKPILPQADELTENPRSRSAKLRFAVRAELDKPKPPRWGEAGRQTSDI
ncbi:16S rRNA (cytosine(1402)-N(4))-methyltransferase RsmH [Neosynechococcus sphagnicola]|uniref:16S rRNA (cytosine(1402)-N(4))-methyltransferase RsmH n=1 Tax=Neosynechococcus sphagnicola TaxID=1501145 RepID=UPI000690598B|nr:16S rRNA (cytosine(1402)-N(4))-methyltransferase RsmH [Neosynechococcus sphagnicola]